MENSPLNDVHEIDQSRWKLYCDFETILPFKSDEEIRSLLNNFAPEDFIAMPMVFDLVNCKKIKLLNWLHQKQIPLIYQDYDGSNALHVSCGAGGNLECVRFFIENNILTDINKESRKFGDTPLTLAICYGHQDIVSFFKEKYSINSISLKELDVILDRVVSNQNRLTGQSFITSKTKYGKK